jgi:hypothetical protein
VSKYFTIYISTNRKYIISLPKDNEATIQNFIASPTMHMTLIKNILSKMEKLEKRIRQSIAPYKSFPKQNMFPHGDALRRNF